MIKNLFTEYADCMRQLAEDCEKNKDETLVLFVCVQEWQKFGVGCPEKHFKFEVKISELINIDSFIIEQLDKEYGESTEFVKWFHIIEAQVAKHYHCFPQMKAMYEEYLVY